MSKAFKYTDRDRRIMATHRSAGISVARTPDTFNSMMKKAMDSGDAEFIKENDALFTELEDARAEAEVAMKQYRLIAAKLNDLHNNFMSK